MRDAKLSFNVICLCGNQGQRSDINAVSGEANVDDLLLIEMVNVSTQNGITVDPVGYARQLYEMVRGQNLDFAASSAWGHMEDATGQERLIHTIFFSVCAYGIQICAHSGLFF